MEITEQQLVIIFIADSLYRLTFQPFPALIN